MLLIDYPKSIDFILWIRPWQNERQRSVNNSRSCKSGNWKSIWSWLYRIKLLAACSGKSYTNMDHTSSWKWASPFFGHAPWAIRTLIGCSQSFRNYWPPLYVKQIVIPCLPLLHNDHQWSINDCWSCIVGYLGGDRLLTVINEVLASSIGQSQWEMLLAISWKWAATEHERVLPFHHGYSQCNMAITVYIHCFDCFCTPKDSRTLTGCSVNGLSCYCHGGCGRNIPYISAYKCCHSLVYECLWSSATHITKAARPRIVNALLTLIFNMG